MTDLGPASDWPCARCALRASDWHHRLPRGRGGPDHGVNMVPLCRKCHSWVEHHPERARQEGWTVPGYMVRGTYVGPDETYSRLFPHKEAS